MGGQKERLRRAKKSRSAGGLPDPFSSGSMPGYFVQSVLRLRPLTTSCADRPRSTPLMKRAGRSVVTEISRNLMKSFGAYHNHLLFVVLASVEATAAACRSSGLSIRFTVSQFSADAHRLFPMLYKP